MNYIRLLDSLSRLSILSNARSITTNTPPVYFQATNTLFAEPLKKKKRMDPQLVRMRDERKKKRLEKQIRRLQKLSKQLKPIDEIEVPLSLIDDIPKRSRKLATYTSSQVEENFSLTKEWSNYMLLQHKKELSILDSITMSQQRALDELKEESKELYTSAISIDPSFISYETQGPAHTPAIKNYSRDGDYTDITKKFEGEE